MTFAELDVLSAAGDDLRFEREWSPDGMGVGADDCPLTISGITGIGLNSLENIVRWQLR